MSSEFDDIDDGLQRDLQPAAPTAPNGAPDGREAQPEPGAADALPADLDAPLGQPDAPSAPPAANNVFEAAAVQALTGEPNTWTVKQWCKKCAAEVLPVGKGDCPRCHCALRLNFKARRHPVNVLRRDAELAKLVARYRPHTTMVQSTCEMQAGILEQLGTLKPGSTEHDRLVKLSQQLFDVLETSLAGRESHSSRDDEGLSKMPLTALEAARDFLTRQIAGEQLTPFEEGQLSILLAASYGRVTLPADPPDVPEFPAYRSEPDTAIVQPASTSRPVSKPAPSQPAPEPGCGYGCGTLTRCDEIKATRPEAWRALHYFDPSEVKRRNDLKTAEMMAQIGKPSRW